MYGSTGHAQANIAHGYTSGVIACKYGLHQQHTALYGMHAKSWMAAENMS